MDARSAARAELREAFEAIDLELADFEDPRFTRLKWLAHLLDTGAVDGDAALDRRWRRPR